MTSNAVRKPAQREDLQVGSIVYRGNGKVPYTVIDMWEDFPTHVVLNTRSGAKISGLTVEVSP